MHPTLCGRAVETGLTVVRCCPQWQISQDTVWDKVLRGTSLLIGALLLYVMRWFVALPFVVAIWVVRLAWNHLFWRPSWVGVAVNAVWHGCAYLCLIEPSCCFAPSQPSVMLCIRLRAALPASLAPALAVALKTTQLRFGSRFVRSAQRARETYKALH